MTNHEKAKKYIAKQKLLGSEVLELELVGEDDVELKKVNDSNSRSIVIPSFITRYSDNRRVSRHPFRDTHYEEIIIESSTGDIHGLFSEMLSDKIKIRFSGDMSITDVSYIFSNVKNAINIEIDIGDGVDISKIRNTKYIYNGCEKLREVDVGWLSKTRLDCGNCMFSGCKSLRVIKNIELLDTSEVTDMSNMFSFCSSIQKLDISKFDFNSVIYVENMFMHCSRLESISINNKCMDKVQNMSRMFFGCKGLKDLDLTGIQIRDVKEVSGLLQRCELLRSVDISGIRGTRVNSIGGLCVGCSKLEYIDISGIKFSGLDSIAKLELDYIFNRCDELKVVVLDKWDKDSGIECAIPRGCRIEYK